MNGHLFEQITSAKLPWNGFVWNTKSDIVKDTTQVYFLMSNDIYVLIIHVHVDPYSELVFYSKQNITFYIENRISFK